MAHSVDTSDLQDPKTKTILIVEDDTAVGEFFVYALRTETPYQALLAIDGLQALEMVKTLAPDLFVLDYQLPHMNGLELADRLRATEELQHVPVLLMSANIPQQELEKRQLPFLAKPFELEELFQIITELLAKQA
ncbi:MAG TPA: response regulator [Ktedonobacteraceae bacterium]|jgi:CheY-like chemotaxis protein